MTETLYGFARERLGHAFGSSAGQQQVANGFLLA
jgi:hypothetical protein